MSAIRTIDVDLAGSIAIDDIESEREFAERIRASYYVGDKGGVVVTGFMHNDARPGKPDLWFPVNLPRFVAREVEKMIEDEVRAQREAA